ncbi:MAG: hypothetical protein H6999_06045 [Hahellaceae bacterium]|nr:hypothetical protein [Hahellaceae bacterium]MCP5169302.1 hypothetical protein [Hahellaceae bacterium]
MRNHVLRIFLAATTAFCLTFSAIGNARVVEETPSALAMTGDAIFVRPVMFVGTLVGAAVYIVSLPFSALGGNAGEAADVLVIEPARTTFVRCLGCTQTGRKKDTVVTEE